MAVHSNCFGLSSRANEHHKQLLDGKKFPLSDKSSEKCGDAYVRYDNIKRGKGKKESSTFLIVGSAEGDSDHRAYCHKYHDH